MMILPTSFKLGRQRWTIEYTEQKLKHRGQACRGLCHFNTFHIQVWRNQSPKMLVSTIVHEFLHACCHSLGLKIPHWVIHALEGPLARLVLLFISGE